MDFFRTLIYSKRMLDFFFELGMLKRVKHEGARLAGVPAPDSIADHSLRAAVIAYVLAAQEGGDSLRCAMMCVLHDMPECRVGDQHKVAARYMDVADVERQVFREQVHDLPPNIRKIFLTLASEFQQRSTRDGIIAKDADWIEMAVSSREYVVEGYGAMQNWIDNVADAVETKTAKQWITELQNADPFAWWRDLKKMTYQKL